MTKPHRNNGWMKASALRGRPPAPVVVVPTLWSELLKEFGLSEESAVNDVRVRSWVKAHYRSRYIPENVLDLVGIPINQRD